MSTIDRQVGAFEAKSKLSELLRETERGSSFVIMRRGKAVARLVPVENQLGVAGCEELSAEFRRLRAGITGTVSTRELIAEGRR
jgi:prevent-host-death family protein